MKKKKERLFWLFLERGLEFVFWSIFYFGTMDLLGIEVSLVVFMTLITFKLSNS